MRNQITKLYGVLGEEAVYFESKEKLNTYIENNNLDKSKLIYSQIEYIGEYEGKENVVKEKIDNEEPCLYCSIDDNNFAYYGNNGWEIDEGNVNEIYSALIEYGIIESKENKYVKEYKSK